MTEQTRVLTNNDDEEGAAVLTARKQIWRVTTTMLVEASTEDEAVEVEAQQGGEVESVTAEPVKDA